MTVPKNAILYPHMSLFAQILLFFQLNDDFFVLFGFMRAIVIAFTSKYLGKFIKIAKKSNWMCRRQQRCKIRHFSFNASIAETHFEAFSRVRVPPLAMLSSTRRSIDKENAVNGFASLHSSTSIIRLQIQNSVGLFSRLWDSIINLLWVRLLSSDYGTRY